MIERILVAVDDDTLLARVLDTASGLAAALGAQIALAHTVDAASASAAMAPGGAAMGTGMDAYAAAEVLEMQEEAGHRFLEQAALRLPGGTAAALMLRSGSPSAAIIDAAREWKADVIVIGTHGRSGFKRLALGSVAEGVVREAPCPVLVVPVEETAD